MASESSATDQSIDEHAEKKKVDDASKCVENEDIIFQSMEVAGRDEEDNRKEESFAGLASTADVSEEKLKPGDVSVVNVTNTEEQHEKVGEVENSLQESEVSNSSEPAVETIKGNLQNQAVDAHELPSEVQEKSNDFVETSASQEPVISESSVDLNDAEIKGTSEYNEAPLVSTDVDISEDGIVEAETQEAANPESSLKDKAGIELIKWEDSKGEIQVLVPDEITAVAVPDTSEVPEKNDIELIKSEDSKDEIQMLVPAESTTVAVPDTTEVQEKNDTDSGNPTSIVVPTKDLEVESGSPEEQKSKESTKPKEPSSHVSAIDTGVEAVGSSSHEMKPLEVAEVVEKNDDGLEAETIQTSVKNQEDLEAKPKLAQAESDVIFQGDEVKMDDEITEGGKEKYVVPVDVPQLTKVSSEEEKTSMPAVVVEEENSLESDYINTVPQVAEVSSEGRNVLDGDKLIDKEKVVNAEAVERDFVDTITDTLEAEVSSDQVKAPTNKGNLQGQADDSHELPSELQEKSSDFVETSASQEPVISESSEDLNDAEIKATSEHNEVPLVSTDVDNSEDGIVEAETQEAADPVTSKDKADIELIKSKDSKGEIQVLVPDKITTVAVPDTYEAQEKNDTEFIKSKDSKNEIQVLVSAESTTVAVPDATKVPEKNDIDLGNPTTIVVPIKDLEVETGSPEEQKSKESTKTKEPSLNVSTVDAGVEAVGSSSYEVKPTEVAEVVEKKDDALAAETIQTSVKFQEDLEAKPKLAQAESDVNVSQGAEIKKDDEITEGSIETYAVPVDAPQLAKVSSEEEKTSKPGVVVEEEENSLESDSIDTVPKVAEVSLEGRNVSEGDKFVDKEKVVNADAVERDFVDTITDTIEANVSSDQVKAPTIKGNLQDQADDAHELPSEVQEKSSEFVETSTSQEPVILESTEALNDTEIKTTSDYKIKQDETPLVSADVDMSEDGYVGAETQEAANPESSSKGKADIEFIKSADSKGEIQLLDPAEITTVPVPDTFEEPDKNDIELMKSEYSKDEIQVSVPAEITTLAVSDITEVPEKNDIDPGNPTSIVVPIKDLEVESGSPGEQKSKENTEIKKPSSNVSTTDAGVEAVGSSSYEVKPSEIAEVVEKKDDGLEAETIQTSVKIKEDFEAKPKLALAESDVNVSQGDEVKKDDEINEGGVETSVVPVDVPQLGKVSFEEEKTSKPSVVVEEEVTSLESDSIDTVPKVAKVYSEGRNVLEVDKLIDKEEIVNAEVVERDFIDAITDTTEAEVSSDKVKPPSTTEIVNEALDVTSKELNIAPEASEVFSEGDKISAGNEKSESLKDEATTVVEVPNNIATTEVPPDQVIKEKNSESSVTEAQAPAEDKLVDMVDVVNRGAEEMNLQSKADDVHESVVRSDFTEKSTSQEPEFPDSKTEGLNYNEIKPTSENDKKPEEAPLVSTGVSIAEIGNLEVETQEAVNLEFSKDKVGIKLINSEDSKEEIQVLVPAEDTAVAAPVAFEAPEKNDIDLSNLTSTEVPVKDLVVESHSSEEQNSNESSETKERSSNVSAIDSVSEVFGSSSNETEPSAVSKVIQKKNDGLEVDTVQSSVKIHKDLEDKPELAQTQSDESDENVSEGVEVKKDDENLEGSIEISTVPDDISSLAKVSYEEEKASDPGVVVEEEETCLKSGNIDTVPKVAQVSFEGGNVLEGDKLVDQGAVLNAEAVERGLVDKITDPTEAEVSFDQAGAPTTTEFVNGTPEVASKEFNIALEPSEVPSEGNIISAGDEKSESFKDEIATSFEVSKDITTAEPLDQVIEKTKSESSVSVAQAASEDKLVDKEKNVNQVAKEINLQSQADGADEIPSDVQSDFAVTFTSQEPVFLKSKNEELKDTEIKPTSGNERKLDEVPLVSTVEDVSEDGNVEAETHKAANPDTTKDKIDIELSEDSKDKIQVLAPVEIPTVVVPDASEVPEKNDDNLTIVCLDVPVNDLEVESGSPEEQKPKESTETKVPSSKVSTSNAGGIVVESSNEAKPSGNAEVVEKKDDGLEVDTVQSSVEIHESLKAKPELSQMQSDENVSKEVDVKKDDEIVDGGIEASTVPDDVPPLAKVSSEEEKASEPGVVVEENGTSLEGDNIDTLAEVSLKGGNALEGDKLVDKEKVVKSEAAERDLVDTFTNSTDTEVSTDQVKTPATTEILKEECDKEALEMTSKELKISPEAIEVPSEVDRFSVGDEEKSESVIIGGTTSVEEPKHIIAVKESLDRLVEKNKSESSVSETDAPTKDKLAGKEKNVNVNVEVEERDSVNTSTDVTAAEVSYEQVKPSESEFNKHAPEETSKELNIAPFSEVHSEDDKHYAAGEENSESLKSEAATSAEAPKDITTVEESLDPVIKEKKSESSISVRENTANDNLVYKDKNVNEGAEERDLVDTSTDPIAAEVSSDRVKASKTAEIVEEESNKQALEVKSKELNIASEASEVPSEGDEVFAGDEEKRESLKSEGATLEETSKDNTVAEESPDQVKQKKSEGSKSEIDAPAEDKLVDKEKDVNVEAEAEKTDTSADPYAAEVVSELVKVSKTAEIVNESEKEPLELTSKELNILPEASEVPPEGDKVSSGEEEKSESRKGEVATSLESPKDFTAAENSIDQVIEENKSQSSTHETEASIETTRDFDTSNLFPKAVNDIISSEAVEEKQGESSNDLSVEEKKANDFEDKKEESKVEGALENATDKPEQAELGAEKADNEKSKDQDPIVSSDTGDAKLTKETTKHESSIFSKVKRSIVKAKKAILRRSPGPKTRSSEAKDENT